MLSIFRRGVTAKIMLVILGIGLFAIVVTGFGTGGSGLGGVTGGDDTIATVQGEKVAASELRDQALQQVEQGAQQIPGFDMATFLRRGFLEETADQMIALAAATAFGREQGLAVSRQMIDAEIANIPAFQNLAGQFDQQAFEAALAREKITPAQLRKDIEARLIQRQLMQPAMASAALPRSISAEYAAMLLESRTGSIGLVPNAAMGGGNEPTDAEIAAFYRQNQARYTIPERRVLRYAVAGPETVAAAAKATDAEIEQAYKTNPAYAAKETRTLSQVVLQEAAARAFVQKVNGGTSFAQAAQQAGFGAADISFPDQTREAYTRTSNAAVANAVFAAQKGALVGPVRGPVGWHVVRIEDVKMTGARPLEAVRAEIAQGIEREKTQAAVGDLAGRLERGIADGLNFGELTQREKLPAVQTPPVTATGQAPGVQGWQAPPELAPMLELAFEAEPNSEPLVVPLGSEERFALFTVSNVIPAAARPLAEIREQVKADLVARRAADRARAVATSIVSKINAGTPPAQAFAEAQVRLPAPRPITVVRREVQMNPQAPRELMTLLRLAPGKAQLVPSQGGWAIVHVQSSARGDVTKAPQVAQQAHSELNRTLAEEYRRQMTNAARARVKVKRNEDALRRLRQELSGGTGQ